MGVILTVNTFEPADQGGEISFSDLFRSAWRSRVWTLGGAVLGVSAAIALTIVSQSAVPRSTAFHNEVAFQVDGTYPNGTAFSTNDLRSPVVLQRVYDEVGLQDYGIPYSQFASLVSISPSSGAYEAVVGRYRARLANTALTYAEREQIEAEFSAALGASVSSGATVSLTLPSQYGIPLNIGEAIVASIPNTWADIYINQLGVLDLPIPLSTSELLSASTVEQLDYPIAYDALTAAFKSMRERMEAIKAISGSQNLTDPVSGRTLYDIGRELDNLEVLSLEHILAPLTEMGLNKAPTFTVASYQYQIDNIDRDIKLATENARIIDELLNSPAGGGNASTVTSTADGALSGTSTGGTVVQQFGPELVDRLVGMSIENAGVGFRENLLNEKRKFESEAVSLTSSRDRLSKRLALINGGQGLSSDSFATTFSDETARLLTSLNTQWMQVNNILTQAAAIRLTSDKALFRPLPTVEPVEASSVLLSRSNLIAWVASGFVGLLAGLVAYFVAGSGQRRKIA